jgi:hypothetical protein
MMRPFFFSLAALMFAAAPGVAQPGPHVVKMTLHPAAPATPAMKYALLPVVGDLRTGNAAVYYHRSRSPEWEHALTRHPDYGQFQEWLARPLSKAPLDRISNTVIVNMLRELDIAARTEQCDWQMLPRLREEGYSMLVPDMQGFRTMSVLLALRSRAEIRDGNFDQAAHSFQTGLAMSKHIGESPYLIAYLIGLATASTTLERVEEFVQQPGAPNLYWSLTDLPRPLIDLRRPLQGERVSVDGLFPEIRQALKDAKTLPIADNVLRACMDRLAVLGIRPDPVAGAVSAATTYPRAKKYLMEHGRSADAIASLPVSQVALMYGMAQYDESADDFYKLNNLPYWEARERLKDLDDRSRGADNGQRSAFDLLFFNPQRIYLGKARLQRRIDLLRCVEAVRLYAAAHGGALPASLEAIREVPIPDDPITGKAFRYTKNGDRAIIEAVAPPGEEANETLAIRIEITLAAAKN